jgi:hypothetical protein
MASPRTGGSNGRFQNNSKLNLKPKRSATNDRYELCVQHFQTHFVVLFTAMTKDELIIQLIKIALGLAVGAYFVWWSLEVLHRLPSH